MNNTTVDVSSDNIRFHFSSSLEYKIALRLQINHKMRASNDELLLFNAARDGKLDKVKELLFKGTGTGYRDWVS